MDSFEWSDPVIGNIIAIPDNNTVVINVGSRKKYYIGDKFVIYEPGPVLKDPSTHQEIGRYDFIKEVVEITEVYENFSVCKKKIVVKKTSSLGTSMSSLLESKTEITFKNLNVDESDIQQWNMNNPSISIGDPVKEA